MLYQPPAKKKSYLSCKKIASFRKGMKKTEKGMVSSSSHTVFAFEREKSITFSCRHRSVAIDGRSVFADDFLYALKIRTLKSGEKRFVFYRLKDNRVRTCNANDMRNKFINLCVANEQSRKKKTLRTSEGYNVYKNQSQRLIVFIRAFLKRHGVSTRGLSKDPFSLMVQLCYPGTRGFDEKTLQTISTGSFLLQDPVASTLRTNGKKSKRLLLQAIERHPRSSQSILRIAKYLRIHRSLDHAQRFLQETTQRVLVVDNGFYDFWISKLTAKQMRVFDRVSIEDIVDQLTMEGVIRDVFRMINQLNANEGFSFTQIEYKTISELHNALVELTPGRRSKSNTQFKHFDFDDNLAMQLCEKLQNDFSHDRYSICYARSTEELQKHADKMHNCAFFYHGQIRDALYAIFCVNEGSKMRYMFGMHIRQWRDKTEIRASLDQAVGACNSRIDDDVFNELNTKIKQALAPLAQYNYEPRRTEDFTRAQLGVNLHAA